MGAVSMFVIIYVGAWCGYETGIRFHGTDNRNVTSASAGHITQQGDPQEDVGSHKAQKQGSVAGRTLQHYKRQTLSCRKKHLKNKPWENPIFSQLCMYYFNPDLYT